MSTSEETLTNFARAVAEDIKTINVSMGFFKDFQIVDPVNTDLIQYVNGKWTNIRKETISDGGNF